VALITGGKQRHRLATAHPFVADGAYVLITGRRHKELDAGVTAIGRNVTGIVAQV